MSDFVDIRNKPQHEQRSEGNLHEHIIAAICDGSRLFFVFDQLLDTDIQPSPVDFSVTVGTARHRVHACSLKSEVGTLGTWSMISLLLDQSLAPGTAITLNYHPEQWFLCTADTDEAVDSFAASCTLASGDTLPEVNFEVEPQAVETLTGVSMMTEVAVSIAHAYDRSVKLTFDQELDLAYQPPASCFRAESHDQWLEVGHVYLARDPEGQNPFPELWVMLRGSLRGRQEIAIAYKPSDQGLFTAEGVKVNGFRVESEVNVEEPADNEADSSEASGIEGHGTWIEPLSSVEASAQAEPQVPVAPVNTQAEAVVAPSVEPAPGDAEHAASTTISVAELDNLLESQVAESDDELLSEPVTPAQGREDSSNAESGSSESPMASAGASLTGSMFKPSRPQYTYTRPKPVKAPPPGQAIRTYLATGKQVAVAVSEPAEEQPLTAAELKLDIDEEIPSEDAPLLQRLTRRRLPARLALGSGVVMTFALVAVVANVGLNMGGSKPKEAPNLLAVSTGRQDCEMNYHDGSLYTGQCMGKRRDGRGRYQWKSGDAYNGTWKDDKMHGKGVLEYRNGDTYKGSFANNLKHGTGAMDWANGARYQGGYNRGKLHGQGTYWNADGRRFEGEFQNGATTNNGTCYFTDGTSQAGVCP